jgi:type IV pilus assembly protein PilM
VVPDLIESNLRKPDGVFETLRDTLTSLGGRSRDVIAVLPDASVRVVLLDFDSLPRTLFDLPCLRIIQSSTAHRRR